MGAPENIITNSSKIAYTTYFNTEKIVKTFSGSFLYTTSTTTRSYTLSGVANNVQVFKIPHGFTRPVFVELRWSLDNSYYVLGGTSYDSGGNYAIAYSDSTYIYIMPSALSGGTQVYYEIVCTWIDDFDTTNPSVSAFSDIPDTYTQVFNSRAVVPLVMKSGVLNSSTTSGVLANTYTTVNHGLGYAPETKVFIESFSGEVWPLNYGGASNPYLIDDNQVEGQIFTSTTDLTVNMTMKSVNGTRRAWYVLYSQQDTDPEIGAYSVTVI